MKIEDYSNIIFIGAGQAAEWIYSQIEDIGTKLKAVGDMLDDADRKKDSFHGLKVTHVSNLTEWFTREDTAVVVAIGDIYVVTIVLRLFQEYHLEKTRTFVPNVYTSLRTNLRSDSFVKEKRIEMNESIRNELGALFNDDISMSIYKELLQAVPWDKPGDFYELKYYPDIEKMYYWDEDYWNSYTFSDSQKETEEATVLDCGAYIGDSVESICELIPQKNIWYYAFEPSPENVAEIYKNECVRSLGDNFKVFACGVGNRNEKQLFECDYTMEGGRFVEEAIEKSYLADLEIHTNTLEVRRLDDLNLEVHGRLYIKMDVEGSELEALKGAENLIKTNRPFLAICLYHRKNDLMQIPLYIKSIVDNYHFYLRGGCHTILWAIPKECE